jgi:hypothetical protein
MTADREVPDHLASADRRATAMTPANVPDFRQESLNPPAQPPRRKPSLPPAPRRARLRVGRLFLVTVGAALLAIVSTSSATAAAPPLIERLSVSGITATGATLEDTVDDDDQPATCDFKSWASPCSGERQGCESSEEVPLPGGDLPASSSPQAAVLELDAAGVFLIPGGEYDYSLALGGAAGEVAAAPRTFDAAAAEWTVIDQGGIDPLPIAVPPDLAVPTSSVTEPGASPSMPTLSPGAVQPHRRHRHHRRGTQHRRHHTRRPQAGPSQT